MRTAFLIAVALVFTALWSLCVSLGHLKPFFPFHWDPHIREYHQLWQVGLYHVAFAHSSELFLGLLLWYHAGRHVERALGSRRYAVALVVVGALHSLGSMAWGAAIHAISPKLPDSLVTERLQAGYLPAGPIGVLTALSVLYVAYTPPLWSILLGDWECTDRILITVPATLVRPACLWQLASSQPPYSMVSALLGVAAAYVYKAHTPLGSLSDLQVPPSLSAFAQRTLGPLVGSTRLPARPSQAQYYRPAI